LLQGGGEEKGKGKKGKMREKSSLSVFFYLQWRGRKRPRQASSIITLVSWKRKKGGEKGKGRGGRKKQRRDPRFLATTLEKREGNRRRQ